jgi:hypothetical protein
MVIEGGCPSIGITAYHVIEFPLTSGRRRPCRDGGGGEIAPGFAMLLEQNALHTLIHQRHLTPSCGGHAPTAERTLDPARIIGRELDPRSGIREQPGSKAAPKAACERSRLVAKTAAQQGGAGARSWLIQKIITDWLKAKAPK